MISLSTGSFRGQLLPPTAAGNRYVSQVSEFESGLSISTHQDDDKANRTEHYYSRNSLKFWNKFYKRHKDKFFKDRHYLKKDWGKYFSDDDNKSAEGKVVLEVGCGAGNTIFPLIDAYPKLYVHACDFSPEAIDLVKSNTSFNDDRINVFLCDIAKDDLSVQIKPSSVDVAILIFVLSAVSPNKMLLVLQNLKRVLKPNGHVLLRDYAAGDFAQVKLQNKNQIISENFYFREDGTCSFYFSEDFLSSLFVTCGFKTVVVNTYCREIENRSKNITMSRRWVRAIFSRL
ncbi:hypothetical protein M9H77_15283 [Catharanthus roseus]|uniref:Uncharacterized protein n=1 Tax=Catharanthus roseus TaxID=4058 RepID=A0ACC0AYK6_CATRO|nr:hypothetical protein M9H77_15283 [Catharanthus roseus]